MKTYSIRQTIEGRHDTNMIITERATGAELAEYRLTPGKERAEIAAMRRTLDNHLSGGGTLHNYQY